MPLSISFELSDRDLEHFTQALNAARAAAGHKNADEIIAAAGKLLEGASKVEVPDFIAQRLDRKKTSSTCCRPWSISPTPRT
jgi:hypothetical protein